MPLFKQADFSGGLNTQFDATKIPANCFPLLVNGRTRENVVAPTAKHVLLSAPIGLYQGLYVFGSYLLLFVDGLAYSADVTQSPILFKPVNGWRLMNAFAPRIYAEQAPATSNLFNRLGTVDATIRTFNDALAVFVEAVYCFDGFTPPQAVLPSNSATGLGSFDTWTQTEPLYVPIGVLPAFAGNSLFVISPDLKNVLESVPGRPSDFVINIDSAGNKGGDAYTTSQTVSFNGITCVRGLSTGEVLVGTLFGTFVLQPDPTNPQFGVPYLNPVFLFPYGIVNELSIIDVLSDTAFITQSGIHAFNAVAQSKRTSNNFPFGVKIRGLLTNPVTKKAIIQKDTCTGTYDDYALFAVNTIFGYGVMVYDTTVPGFQSLDLSFGRVKQFATTKINDSERLFFITQDNQIYEGFADPSRKNINRILLGEFSAADAPSVILSYMVDLVFTQVQNSGQVKISFFGDRILRSETVLEVEATSPEIHLPVVIPFVTGQTATPGAQFHDKVRSWKCAVMVEWNFDGSLAAASVDGEIQTGDNTKLELPVRVDQEKYCFLADSGYAIELNTGGSFDSNNLVIIGVGPGQWYAYDDNGNGPLVNGNELVYSGVFQARGETVAIQGTGARTFSLRPAQDYMDVLLAVYNENPSRILHGGDFAYYEASALDVKMALFPLVDTPWLEKLSISPGNHDIITESGKYFFNGLNVPRYYPVSTTFIDFFHYNGNSSEPDGIGSSSVQAGVLRNWLTSSTKPFKIVIVHESGYTNDESHYPGDVNLRFLASLPGLSACLSGHSHNMERFDINGFPWFVCGTGGSSLRGFITPNQVTPAFQSSGQFGYLRLTVDPLSCRVEFVTVAQDVLDTYALYPK